MTLVDDCRNPGCTRIGDRCVGYHCSRCGLPCNSMGHQDCGSYIDAAWREERRYADANAALADSPPGHLPSR